MPAVVDRAELADFLRRRRDALRPEDVGLPRGPRRRTRGLRREEVAQLSAMSTDYYTRLEQQRGPQPSESMLAAIARGLRLTQDERDHVFRLAGHEPPSRARRSDHVNPALMRVLDRLDTPAMVVTDLGETLVQNGLAVALVGDHSAHTGLDRHLLHRWFGDPDEQHIYPEEDRPHHERQFVADLRAVLARDPEDDRARTLRDVLLANSPAFAERWAEHHVQSRSGEHKRIVHPAIGELRVHCQKLVAADEGQALLVFTAAPGTQDAEKLELIGVVGRTF